MAQRGPAAEAHPFGPAVGRLVEEFARLPGIGRKTAERLANHVLSVAETEALQLADAIREVKRTVHRCRKCGNLTDAELCSFCSDPRRDPTVICVVEQPRDVAALDAAGVYQGSYHVLGGRLAPLDGVGPDDLTIDLLMRRVRDDRVREIVMGTNPTLEGDGTALYIANLLQDTAVKITRLARGIPTGSVLEFANKEMLADALQGRQSF
jgi:recombination protein RecR